MRRRFIVRLIKHRTEFVELLARELSLADEMGEHRLERPAENAINERSARRRYALFFRYPRLLRIYATPRLVIEGLLFHQPGEQRARGLRVPAPIGSHEAGDDVGGGDGMVWPHDAHHFPFGVGYLRRLFPRGRVVTTTVIQWTTNVVSPNLS